MPRNCVAGAAGADEREYLTTLGPPHVWLEVTTKYLPMCNTKVPYMTRSGACDESDVPLQSMPSVL